MIRIGKKMSNKLHALLKRKFTPIQTYIILWIALGLGNTIFWYSYFTELEPLVLKALMELVFPMTVTLFGFFGAIIIFAFQLFDRAENEHHRIAIDARYRLLKLSRANSNNSILHEIQRTLNDNNAKYAELKRIEEDLFRFFRLLLAVFLFTMFYQIWSYSALSSSNTSLINIYYLVWFALMMTFGIFLGFVYVLWNILS